MIRVGLYNFVNQSAANAYIKHVGTDGPLHVREQRASDWRMQNPALWVSDEQMKVEQTPPSEPDPNAERKARWAYRSTQDAPKIEFVPLIDSAVAADYDTWNFERVHPALRR